MKIKIEKGNLVVIPKTAEELDILLNQVQNNSEESVNKTSIPARKYRAEFRQGSYRVVISPR